MYVKDIFNENKYIFFYAKFNVCRYLSIIVNFPR
jgi:hypothetical protein